jgi:AraC-like DNA-binding protein
MKKKSLFFKFFTALTLLVTVPMIIITVILSYDVMRYSESEISKSYIGKLKVANNFSEMIAQRIYIQALKLTMDGNLNHISDISADKINNDPEAKMSAYYLQESIMNLINTNDILHSVYLLGENSDYLITSNQGGAKLNEFTDKGWIDDYHKFKEYKSEPVWMPTRVIDYSEDGTDDEQQDWNKVITFFYSFTPYTTAAKGTLIFNVHEKELRRSINSNSFISEGYIAIINSNGDVISHVREELVGKKLPDDYLGKIIDDTGNEGYIINKAGNERQLITYYKSEFNNWIYVGVFPMDMLTGKVSGFMMKTICICLLFMALCILISYIVSKRISSPLEKLVHDIRVNKGINIKSNDSELSILSKAFEHMMKEESKLFSILENSKDSSRNTYLTKLLQGESTNDFSKEMTGIDFIHDSYICAIILIDRYYEFTGTYSDEQQEYMKTLILKVSEDLIGKEFRCAGLIFQDQKIVFIINYNANSVKNVDNMLRNIFAKIQAQVSKVMDNTISIGVGNGVQTQGGIAESFNRAQEALKHKLLTGHGSINTWKDIDFSEVSYYYPYSIEKHILNMIGSGISDKIEETVSELVSEIRSQKFIQYENVMQVFIQLTVNTVKLLLDRRLNVSMIFGGNYNLYQVLSGKETLEDIGEWLVEIFVKIAKYIESARCDNKSNFNRALDYIHENFRKDIDIGTIAEHTGLSYSHLRKIFKEETGVNITSYVNQIRIDESKSLLSRTGMTIREIALALGYNNEQSFIRYFKKYENMSPGEYRQSKKPIVHIAARASSMYNR